MTFLLCLSALAGPLQTVRAELDRAMETLSTQDEKPHYVAAAVEDWEEVDISARAGTLGVSRMARSRFLDVDMRVGTPELDSTHPLRGFSAMEGSGRDLKRVAIDDDYALKHALWRELDRAWRDGREKIVMVRANQNVKVEEEDPAPDFTPGDKHTHIEEPPALEIDQKAWEDLLVDISKRMENSPAVHRAVVALSAERATKTFVDTEGSELVHGRLHARFSMQVQTIAADGDRVSVFRATDVHDPASLPDRETALAWADAAVERLEALVKSERGEPYSGPVILKGKATGVFFHEVFGHRVEGHRQKREDEGKTFADHVGKPILPPFIDVYDDPTIPKLEGVDLNGFYAFDDEGTPAQRADLVDDGIFQGFLMGRSPIAGFAESNGHGRRSAGNPPVSRMGNTIVDASTTVSDAQLRAQLVAELKKQDLDYGYIVEDIDGGFTMTGRMMPNAFNVRASASWRVYADGRPDELVRGIDLVGTPFVAFSNLVAASETRDVFNGVCGAESGWVPVSAVAPSVLIRKLEFQLKEKGQERPPLLAKPATDTDGVGEAE